MNPRKIERLGDFHRVETLAVVRMVLFCFLLGGEFKAGIRSHPFS